jgi:transmembrane sensor
MALHPDQAELPDLTLQAIEWLVRLRSDAMGEAETHAFADWLSEDSRHAQAFAEAEDLFQNLAIAAKTPRVIAPGLTEPDTTQISTRLVPTPNNKPPASRPLSTFKESLRKLIPIMVRRPTEAPVVQAHHEWNQQLAVRPEPVEGLVQRFLNKSWLALPLALAAAWLFAVGLVLPKQAHLFDDYLSDYHTHTGEVREIQLTDGSQLLLNTNTAVSVQYQDSIRQITLHHGQARFTVAKDSQRPFEVKSGGLLIRALGTVFEVYRQKAGETLVTVQEHAVAARLQPQNEPAGNAQSAPVTVQEGQQLRYGGNGSLSLPETVDIAQASAWQQHKISLNDRPLGELIAELDRYRVGRIFLADAKLNNLRVVGVFNLADPDTVLKKVCKVLALKETRLGPLWVLLHR